MEDTARETRSEAALALPERRERFELRLRKAEDFLRQSLQELDSQDAGGGEDGEVRAAVLDLPADTWVASCERLREREGRRATGMESPILVVDLDDGSRSALCELLRTSGYPVLGAGSSADFPAGEEITPRLIVFDPGPYLDAALRTVARMRIQQGTLVPVVLLSAAVTPETRGRALAIGCSEALPKPCSPAELLSTIGRLLEPAPLHAD